MAKGEGPSKQGERVALFLQRPEDDVLSDLDKGGKYNALKQYNELLRDSIITWLEEQDLAGDVEDVSEPTVFGMLFVTTNPEVVERLKEAPGVLDVSVSPEWSVGLPVHKEVLEEEVIKEDPDSESP